jgi:cell division septation protein DedD
MTLRDLPRSKLLASLSDQLRSASFVVLVATDSDRERVAEDAWRLASALATPARRVCLVDLFLGNPMYDASRGAPAGEGIVDAFLYGVSMQRVAVEQDVAGLFFIAPGAPVSYPDEVWGNARWRRLQRGFASEGALLALLVPAAAAHHLPPKPEHVVLLANALSETPNVVLEWAKEGIPVSRVLSERDLPPEPDEPVATRAPEERTEPEAPASAPVTKARPTPRPRWNRTRAPAGGWAIALVIGAIAVAAVAAFEILRTTHDLQPGVAATGRGTSPPPSMSGPSAGDSLFYTIQIATYTSAALATEQATTLEAAGWTATVAPVRLGRQGTWHRLMVGALRNPAEAQRALEQLWSENLLDRSSGTVLHTPFAIELAKEASRGAAEAQREGVRTRGFVGYIVRAADGSYRVLVGAFETAEQAERADSILNAADINGTIVRRTGFVR